ncbi:hypothetical protein KCV01_g9444, partial [Aureobasidium melanogenum]
MFRASRSHSSTSSTPPASAVAFTAEPDSLTGPSAGNASRPRRPEAPSCNGRQIPAHPDNATSSSTPSAPYQPSDACTTSSQPSIASHDRPRASPPRPATTGTGTVDTHAHHDATDAASIPSSNGDDSLHTTTDVAPRATASSTWRRTVDSSRASQRTSAGASATATPVTHDGDASRRDRCAFNNRSASAGFSASDAARACASASTDADATTLPLQPDCRHASPRRTCTSTTPVRSRTAAA